MPDISQFWLASQPRTRYLARLGAILSERHSRFVRRYATKSQDLLTVWVTFMPWSLGDFLIHLLLSPISQEDYSPVTDNALELRMVAK